MAQLRNWQGLLLIGVGLSATQCVLPGYKLAGDSDDPENSLGGDSSDDDDGVGGSGAESGGGTGSTGGSGGSGGSGGMAGADSGGGGVDTGGSAGFALNGFAESGPWIGGLFTDTDLIGGTVSPAGDDPFADAGVQHCVTGTLASSYESFAVLGWNLAQATRSGPVSTWAVTGNGVQVTIADHAPGAAMRLQVEDTNGGYYCTEFVNDTPIYWNQFRMSCWDATGAQLAQGTLIKSLVIQVPSTNQSSSTTFDFCLDNVEFIP